MLALLLVTSGGPSLADPERTIALPRPQREGSVSVEQALDQRRSVRDFAPEPLPLAAVSQILWAAQGITDPSGLRSAPSAGALYPLEIHLVAGAVSGLEPGVYRYDPHGHRLVAGARGDRRAALARAALGQDWIADAPAIVLVTAIHQRTTRKYGDRATRYVHMEAGHAAQNVYLQAVSLGLGTTMVGAFRDGEVARAVDLPGREEPLGLLPIGKPR